MGYNGPAQQVAIAEKVLYADMGTLAANEFEALGQEKTAAYFPIDHTHTSAAGADLNAHAVVTALRKANAPLVRYMKPDSKINQPNQL